MKRQYRGYIEIRGQVKLRSHPMQLSRVKEWIRDQRKVNACLLRPNGDWSIYYETESIPDPNKANFSINQKCLSEHEKIIEKYL